MNPKSCSARRRRFLAVEVLEARDCPASYSIIDLFPPAGATSSAATGLNDTGIAVGSTSIGGYSRAAVWQVGSGATALGVLLPGIGSVVTSSALDVNNSGMIAGYSDTTGASSRAVVWTKAAGAYVAHDLGEGQASAVSEADPASVTWVVGGTGTHACVWRVDSVGSVLASIQLEPTLTLSRANDIRVVDLSATPGDEYVLVTGEIQVGSLQPAVVWRLDLAGNVMSRSDLGTLGGTASWGRGISADGHVVGQSKTANGSALAFMHREGEMLNLGTLTNGGSQATGINDDDTVVGSCEILSRSGAVQSFKAFIWQDGSMVELRNKLGAKEARCAIAGPFSPVLSLSSLPPSTRPCQFRRRGTESARVSSGGCPRRCADRYVPHPRRHCGHCARRVPLSSAAFSIGWLTESYQPCRQPRI